MQTTTILTAFRNTAASVSHDLMPDEETHLSEAITETLNNWDDILNQPVVPREDCEELTGQLIDILEDELSQCDPNQTVITGKTYDELRTTIAQALLAGKY